MRQTLSKRDIKELNEKIMQEFNVDNFFDKKEKVECLDKKTILKQAEKQFFYLGDRLVPSLRLLLKNNFLPKVVVDMPAVKFMVSGADVMRPGIKDMDQFDKDKIVCIVDEQHKKPLAVGIAMFSNIEIRSMEKGKVIRNIHHVGDEVWNE